MFNPENDKPTPPCPICGTDTLQIGECEYECSVNGCNGEINEVEPDPDSMPGGRDYEN